MLDNIIAAKRLPVMAAVMVMPGANPERGPRIRHRLRQIRRVHRGRKFCPRAEKEAGITITKDPDARMTLGGSSGGAASFTMAWFHPEWYHLAFSYSGSFANL